MRYFAAAVKKKMASAPPPVCACCCALYALFSHFCYYLLFSFICCIRFCKITMPASQLAMHPVSSSCCLRLLLALLFATAVSIQSPRQRPQQGNGAYTYIHNMSLYPTDLSSYSNDSSCTGAHCETDQRRDYVALQEQPITGGSAESAGLPHAQRGCDERR